MKKRMAKYTDEPIGEIEIIDDFLPRPEQLVLKAEQTKVTLALSTKSVDFFKKMGKKLHVPYQTMIRALIDQYASHYLR